MMKNKLPTNKQIALLRISMGMSGIGLPDYVCDTILRVQEKVRFLGGKFTLHDAAEIEWAIREQYFPDKNKARKKAKPTK